MPMTQIPIGEEVYKCVLNAVDEENKRRISEGYKPLEAQDTIIDDKQTHIIQVYALDERNGSGYMGLKVRAPITIQVYGQNIKASLPDNVNYEGPSNNWERVTELLPQSFRNL